MVYEMSGGGRSGFRTYFSCFVGRTKLKAPLGSICNEGRKVVPLAKKQNETA